MPDKYRAISAVTPREGKLTIAVAGLLFMDYIEGREDQTGFSGHEDLQFIEQFFKAGDTWHFLSVPRPDLVEFEPSSGVNNQLIVKQERYYDPEKQTSVLVAMVKNQEGGITLRRRTVKLDSEPFFGWSDRPVLATADGFWCGTRDGAVFFPTESKSEPIVLSGRQVVRIIQVDENHMLMLSENGDATLRPLKAVKEESSTVVRIEKTKTGSFLVDDGAGRVLGRLPDPERRNHTCTQISQAALQDLEDRSLELKKSIRCHSFSGCILPQYFISFPDFLLTKTFFAPCSGSIGDESGESIQLFMVSVDGYAPLVFETPEHQKQSFEAGDLKLEAARLSR